MRLEDNSTSLEFKTFSSSEATDESQRKEDSVAVTSAVSNSVPAEINQIPTREEILVSSSLEKPEEPVLPSETTSSSISRIELPFSLLQGEKNMDLDQGKLPVEMLSSPVSVIHLLKKTDILEVFLAGLNITTSDLSGLGISKSDLLKLFQQETGWFSGLKWSRLEQIVDNLLHGLLLSRRDLFLDSKKRCESRIRPMEHSLLLRTQFGLRKAQAGSRLAYGLRLGVFEFVRIFIASMLLYRLGLSMRGQSGFNTFETIFGSNNQKGIDSLTGLLAQLKPSILKFILSSPLIITMLPILLRFTIAEQGGSQKINYRINMLTAYLEGRRGWWPDVVRESIPLLSYVISVSSMVQKLERWLNWDGSLNLESRQQAFSIIRRMAREGHKVPQWTAMKSLARLVQGISLRDFSHLQSAGYDQAVLEQLLWIKVTAFSDLVALSEADSKATTRLAAFRTWPRRLYASYLLWWLGQATSWQRQRIPFLVLKTSILGLEIYFFYNIINSLVAALRCPDKPGFQLGEGYLPWASDYTAECFTRRIFLFNSAYGLQTVSELLTEIPRYHLTDFKVLHLANRGLPWQDLSAIVQAIAAQGASLQILELAWNPLGNLFPNGFVNLNKLQFLSLSKTSLKDFPIGFFMGLNSLQSLDLSENLIGNWTVDWLDHLDRLQFLNLSGNLMNYLPANAFTSATQLRFLDLSRQPLKNLSVDTFSSLSQLQILDLSYTQLRDLPINIFTSSNQLRSLSLAYCQFTSLSPQIFTNLTQLEYLDLSGNQLNTSTVTEILLALPATLMTLNISSNLMQDLPASIISLWPPSLQSLAVGGNPFIPSTINATWVSNFPTQLISFSLGESHKIINISAGAFTSLTQLQYLNLSYNQLSNWSDGILPIASPLKSLDLSWNNLTYWPTAGLASLGQLQSLILKGNSLNNLSADLLSGLSQLQFLDLSNNSLIRWPTGGFSRLTNLQSLVVTYNPYLTDLPVDTFSGVSQLRFLNISFNNLTGLPAGLFINLSQLQTLDLSNNQLSYFPVGVFSGLGQLQYLDLSVNQQNDETLQNMLVNFPYQISTFITSFDNIVSVEGVTTAFNLLNCLLNLNSIQLEGNLADLVYKIGFSTVINLFESLINQLLKNVCADQLCHANLPLSSESCSLMAISATSTAASSKHSSKLARRHEWMTVFDSKHSTIPQWTTTRDWSWPNSSIVLQASGRSALPMLSASGESTSPLSTSVNVGATILGVVGLGVFLYKNATWIKAVVNTGYHVFQYCCGKKATTTVPPKAVHPQPHQRSDVFAWADNPHTTFYIGRKTTQNLRAEIVVTESKESAREQGLC